MRNFGRFAALAAAAAGVGLALTPPAIVEPARRSQRVRVMDGLDGPRESKLNRSRHWDYAETYKDARAISPFPHRPVS